MTEEEKELDEILQIILPDDYYEVMRTSLIPYLIKWKNQRKKYVKKERVPCNCVFELINDKFKCPKCGLTAGSWLSSEIKKKSKRQTKC